MSELNLSDFSATAFDFDNTIAEGSLHNKARHLAFRQMYEETGDRRFIEVPDHIHDEAHRHGSSPITIIGWTLQQMNIIKPSVDLHSSDLLMSIVQKKHTAYDEMVLHGADEIEGAGRFIKKLYNMQPGRLSIVTTARRNQEVLPFLKRHQLGSYFPDDQIITKEDVAPDLLKPHPAAYLLALGKFALEASPERMLVIEDTFHGIESAKRAGARVVGIATTHTKDELNTHDGPYRPDWVVGDYAELKQFARI